MTTMQTSAIQRVNPSTTRHPRVWILWNICTHFTGRFAFTLLILTSLQASVRFRPRSLLNLLPVHPHQLDSG